MPNAPRQRVVEAIVRQDRERRARDLIAHCAEVLERGPTPEEASSAVQHCHGHECDRQPMLDLRGAS